MNSTVTEKRKEDVSPMCGGTSSFYVLCAKLLLSHIKFCRLVLAYFFFHFFDL